MPLQNLSKKSPAHAIVEPEKVLQLRNELAPWHRIDPRIWLSELPSRIKDTLAQLEALIEGGEVWSEVDFEMFELHLQALLEWWQPLSNLSNTQDTACLREVLEAAEPIWNQANLWILHHAGFYRKNLKTLENQSLAGSVAALQAVRLYVQSSESMGIHLPVAARAELADQLVRLSQLQHQFGNQLLDAERLTHVDVRDPAWLEGIPENLVQSASRTPQGHWRFKVDGATVGVILKLAKQESMRRAIYEAASTLASDQARHNPEVINNAPVLLEMIRLRAKIAERLGFAHHADFQLKGRTLERAEAVTTLISTFQQALRGVVEREAAALQAFVESQGGSLPIQAWDLSFWINRLTQARCQIDGEMTRAYFPISKVLEGLFWTLRKLFGLQVQEARLESTWNDAVRFFRFSDAQGAVVGGIYFDLYHREGKRSGAWADDLYHVRQEESKQIRRAVAMVHCNLAPPLEGGVEARLDHTEVVTLFHEVGHALQMILTHVSLFSVTGLNGIPWDAVEVASQLMESWAWQPEVLKAISAHSSDGHPMPDLWIERLTARRKFLNGLRLARTLSFSELDMTLHTLTVSEAEAMDEQGLMMLYRRIHADWLPEFPLPDFARFPHQFSHIFAGGYSAGYHSYIYSEIMARHHFDHFLQGEGPFDAQQAKLLRATLYGQGGTLHPMVQFQAMRGCDPDPTRLLAWYGLEEAVFPQLKENQVE